MSEDLTADGTRSDAPAPGPAAVDGRERPASKPTHFTQRQRVVYLGGALILLFALGTLAVYVWKGVAVRTIERRFAVERAESSSAQRQALTTQARDLLRLTARPLAWSVRAELLRGNTGQIDDYFRELVHERGVASLILVDKDGRIALATNRKLETQPAASVVSMALLGASEVASEESGSSLRMAVPVMAFDRRLGTLVVDYDLQAR